MWIANFLQFLCLFISIMSTFPLCMRFIYFLDPIPFCHHKINLFFSSSVRIYYLLPTITHLEPSTVTAQSHPRSYCMYVIILMQEADR